MPKFRGISAEEDKPKPFLDHLEDLRNTIIRCALVLGISFATTFPFTPKILKILMLPLKAITDQPERFLQSLDVTGAFTVAVQIAFWSALILASPFLIIFIFQFILPGLKRAERRVISLVSIPAFFLFVAGVLMCYYMTLPVALNFMFKVHAWLGINMFWTITSYIAFTTHMLIGFGLAFQLPALLLVLGYLGVLSSDFLRSKRRHAIVLILIMSMILTPPDVFSMIIMAIPLLLFYEGCVWLVKMAER
ncbi:MAG: twin-arginine translocase subunit TatC [Lentisphaerae bacterium]|nr:twin-arginine translocase subunit TatC [Lentisphaerota bacterium]